MTSNATIGDDDGGGRSADANPPRARQTFRGFWHGCELGPYQLLCLRSFVTHGHQVEVFSYDRGLSVPDWVALRDAGEILPTDHVLHYRTGFGAGSPALHSNLFRYAMLHRLGGWWIDLDVVMLRPDPPPEEVFVAVATQAGDVTGNAVIKFPQGHELLAEAVDRCTALGENVSFWGETGPLLLTELLEKHGLAPYRRPAASAYPVPWSELVALFDPARCAEVQNRCIESYFLHLFNEAWRGSGIPVGLGPPEGSFLDQLFGRHDVDARFRERIKLPDVTRWIANRKEWIRREEINREIEARYRALEARSIDLEAQCLEVEARCRELEARCRAFEPRYGLLEAERDALLASTSWRLTAPLRALARLLRGTH